MDTSLQDPTTQIGVPSSGWWRGWQALAEEPALLEVLLVAMVVMVAAVLNLRLSKRVRDARGRAAVRDYLLGVEQALSGDRAGARQRLEKVLAEDPENHHARLLYGEVLAEMGESAEAHKHHLFLHRAFKLDSPRNDCALARNLLEVGRAADAVDAAQRAVAARPNDRATVELLLRAQLAAGCPGDAAETALGLARVTPQGEQREAVRRRAAVAYVMAANARWRRGEIDAADKLCVRAEQLAADHRAVATLRARVRFARTGEADVARLAGGGLVPSVSAPASVAVVEADRIGAAEWHGLAPVEPYVCRSCGVGLPSQSANCGDCGVPEPARPAEDELFQTVASPAEVMDDVDANRSHVRRQIARVVSGDAAAADDLVEIGDAAVDEVLTVACRNAAAADALVALLQRMGPSILPALFSSFGALKERRLRNVTHLLYNGSHAGVLGRVVQGFGRPALPYFEELLGTRDRDLRKVVVDYFIGLGDEAELDKVLARFPPVEVIHRLNVAETQPLVSLLRSVRAGGFAADGLLLEPIYRREREIIMAISQAVDPPALVAVLIHRGHSPGLTEMLVEHLAREDLREACGAVLDAFGNAALDHMLSCFADPDQPAAVRRELRQRICALGPVVVERVCALFGPDACDLDADVHQLLADLGPAACPALADAYQRTSLRERISAGLLGRYNHRRSSIIRALAELAGRVELEQLRRRETDANLKIRLAQALQALAASDAASPTQEGDHGQAG